MDTEQTFAELAFGPEAWERVHKLGWTTSDLTNLILQRVEPLDNCENTNDEYFNEEYERFVDDVRTKVVWGVFNILF